ncbi:pentapeptide repeat-containing protein [Salmonella enterica]|nr:pentapeptide repeat-containing protein [Salmonella enterica]
MAKLKSFAITSWIPLLLRWKEHKVWITSMRESGSRANLLDADLRDANLRDADLRCADLCGANLYGADLPDLTFVILGEKYFISITNGEYVRAGCQNHTVEEWRKYSKQEIAEMDGRKALKFYPRLLDIIDFYIGKGERPDWLTSKEYADEVTE